MNTGYIKLFAVVILSLAVCAYGQTNTPKASATSKKIEWVDFSADLDRVTADLKQKFDSPPEARTNFEANLRSINTLILQHQKDGNREQLARLYLLAAHVQADGLTNNAKAMAIWTRVILDFPKTLAAQGAAISLAKAKAQDEAAYAKIPEGLEIGQRFPLFTELDSSGAPLALAAYRGHVTMVDFWATWCGPCKLEMPNVIATYRAFHAQGFEIVGVSLDSDISRLTAYTQMVGMTWAQYFDGQGWKNKLAVKYGVDSIPISYLLDRHGVIVGKGLRGGELAAAVAKTLASN